MGTVNDDYPTKAKKQMSDADLKAKAIAQYEADEITEKVKDHKFPTEIILTISGCIWVNSTARLISNAFALKSSLS